MLFRENSLDKKKQKKVVIKLSGSLFSLETKGTLIASYAKLFQQLTKHYQIVLVAGGGNIARHYISVARSLGSDEASLDLLGIEVSRLNGQLLLKALNEIAYPVIPKDLNEVSLATETAKIVITGGLHPGQSTNATAALICEKINAFQYINATDVEGIYDSDPNKYKKARLIKEISVAQCMNLLSKESTAAGKYDLMDVVALKVIERSKIVTSVIKLSIPNIRNILLKNINTGTKISC
jgi:uridylate kinase